MAVAPTPPTAPPAHPAGTPGATGPQKGKAPLTGRDAAAAAQIAVGASPTQIAAAQYGPDDDKRPTNVPHGVISALDRGASATGVAGAPMPPGKQLSDGNPNGTSFGQGPHDKISFYGGAGVAQLESKHVNVKQLEDPNFKPGADFMAEVAQQLLAMGLIRPGRDPAVVAAEKKAKEEAEAAAKKTREEADAAAKKAAAAPGATAPAQPR
jgi:hypothetical protein